MKALIQSPSDIFVLFPIIMHKKALLKANKILHCPFSNLSLTFATSALPMKYSATAWHLLFSNHCLLH